MNKKKTHNPEPLSYDELYANVGGHDKESEHFDTDFKIHSFDIRDYINPKKKSNAHSQPR